MDLRGMGMELGWRNEMGSSIVLVNYIEAL
jgi:hypothetical protein